MEASSPLAAMQPSSAFLGGHCGFRADASTAYPNYATIKGFGPNCFNFKDLSMKKSRSDYFTMQPVRGSSPTASLAADLSQNFHIDQRYGPSRSPNRVYHANHSVAHSYPLHVVHSSLLRSWEVSLDEVGLNDVAVME